VVAGFCYRYEKVKQEWMKRIHGGDIGKIVAMQCVYHANELWHRDREDEWDDMTYQLRNWLYFTWLSGDHIVEQACHSIDKMAWAMHDETPLKCVGSGGRAKRTGKEFGHIFDHHSVVFEYKSGVKMFHSCRQQNNTTTETSDWVYGTEGTAEILSQRTHKILGKKPWSKTKRPGDKDNMYQNEHDDLFASIRAGKPINDGEWMARSTMMAIMGRMATYTGLEISWEKALKSEQNLAPKKYEFGPLAVPEVAQPGITKFS
jgi:predicted dehydrogenase